MLASISIVLFAGAGYSGLAEVCYMMTGLVMAVHGFVMGARRKKLEKRLDQQVEEQIDEQILDTA